MSADNGTTKKEKGVNGQGRKSTKAKKKDKSEVENDHMSDVEQIVQGVQKQDATPVVAIKEDGAAIMDDHRGDSHVA